MDLEGCGWNYQRFQIVRLALNFLLGYGECISYGLLFFGYGGLRSSYGRGKKATAIHSAYWPNKEKYVETAEKIS